MELDTMLYLKLLNTELCPRIKIAVKDVAKQCIEKKITQDKFTHRLTIRLRQQNYLQDSL